MSNTAPTTTTRTTLASIYNVSLKTFNGWIDENPTLLELFKPYRDENKKTLPPKVMEKVLEILGEP